MKKELIAVLLLLIILAGNLWNQRRLDRLTGELTDYVEETYASAQEGDWAAAENAARSAEETWIGAHAYTHIFIRHTDVDTLTAAFCDYRGAISGRDDGDILAAYLRLKTGLHCLRDMETLSAGSIF